MNDIKRRMNGVEAQVRQLLGDINLPYKPFRKELYTVKELMHGYSPRNPNGSRDSIIARHYKHQGGQAPRRTLDAMAQRIHDNSIDRALIRFVLNRRHRRRRKIVGIMGGHSASRKDSNYVKVARIARELTANSYCIVSGGGPGIMEAANLGAYMAAFPRGELQNALEILAKFPDYGKTRNSRANYIKAAKQVLERYPHGRESLAIPTWGYSDEPISQFPSAIGKYFANSIREDGLVGIGIFGLIFAPGSSGTMQEIFQDAAQNSYWSFHLRSPMVLLDSSFYRANPSIYDVLLSRANKDGYADLVSLQDDPDEVVKFIIAHQPQRRHRRRPKSLHTSPWVQLNLGTVSLLRSRTNTGLRRTGA